MDQTQARPGESGANKACEQETASTLLSDIPQHDDGAAPCIVTGRPVVTWPGWLAIDRAETTLARRHERARTTIYEIGRLVQIGTATEEFPP